MPYDTHDPMTSMNWTEICVCIATVRERLTYLLDLQRQLLPIRPLGAEIVVHTHREGDPPSVDYPALIALALSTNRRWILALEDDIWLAPDFKTRALKAIAHTDAVADAITFFSRLKADLKMLVSCRNYAPVPRLSSTLAVAVHRSVLIGFPEWAPSWYVEHPEHKHASDLLLNDWLRIQQAKLLRHVPSLVQHRYGESILHPQAGPRRSQTYELAFGGCP